MQNLTKSFFPFHNHRSLFIEFFYILMYNDKLHSGGLIPIIFVFYLFLLVAELK